MCPNKGGEKVKMECAGGGKVFKFTAVRTGRRKWDRVVGPKCKE